MTAYLYVLSIGPVQDFIAAARRTRDLWFGSYLLSEISKAAARKIAESGGKLIFPALEKGDPELKSPTEGEELKAFNVANVILAELPEEMDLDPVAVDTKAQEAARKKWVSFAEGAKMKAGNIVRDDIWKDQVDDVIEFNAAWVPLGDDYAEARRRCMRLLAGRKSIRNFGPVKKEYAGVPKSSLDGARESVLKKDLKLNRIISLQMRLNDGEQLCAVGLTKRLGGNRMPFPSVSRVALDPWIRNIRGKGEKAQAALAEIGKLCAGEHSFVSGTGKMLYQYFPYDGQICYSSRLESAKRDLKKISPDKLQNSLYRDDPKKLEGIEKHLRTLWDRNLAGEPNPYLAILVADGDHMGEAISKIKSAEEHRAFSRQLAAFAQKARNIVENSYHGCMVYSGGDDVLAFLPVDMCLDAARALHEEFGKNERGLTLSVGIAIGHIRDPLEDLLNYGRAAERAAKNPDRNGLAVHLHTRSGGAPLKIREQWKPEGQNSLDERLGTWVDMHRRDAVPDKAAYDLLQMAEEYQCWKPVPDDLLEKDVRRLLKRKKAAQGTKNISDDDMTALMHGLASASDLQRRANELVIARRLAAVTDGGDSE